MGQYLKGYDTSTKYNSGCYAYAQISNAYNFCLT